MLSQQQAAGLDIGRVGDVTVVRFACETIWDEIVIHRIGEQLLDLVKESAAPQLVIDFSGVKYFSSSMLGKLLLMHTKTRAKGGRVVFCAIAPELYEVFKDTQLEQTLHICRDEQEALASFLRTGG